MIRRITEKNLNEVAEVYARAFNKANYGENWTPKIAEKLMQFFFEKQPDLFFIAEKNEKILGGIVGIIMPWDQGNILTDTELFIDPEFQNQGIAKELLKNIIKTAINQYQIVTIDGITDSKKEFPISWYRKIGFKETGWVYVGGDPKEILSNL